MNWKERVKSAIFTLSLFSIAHVAVAQLERGGPILGITLPVVVGTGIKSLIIAGSTGTASGGGSINLSTNGTSSSNNTVVLGGSSNTSSGIYAVSCGLESTASGQDGFSCGEGGQDRGRFGSWVWGNYDNNPGDSQTSQNILWQNTSSTSQARLTADGNSGGDIKNSVNIPVTTMSFYTINVVGKDDTSSGNASAVNGITGIVDCGATLSTCTWVSTSSGTLTNHGTGLAANTSVSVSADTTYGGVNIQVTPPNSHAWDWVAFVQTTEAQ